MILDYSPNTKCKKCHKKIGFHHDCMIRTCQHCGIEIGYERYRLPDGTTTTKAKEFAEAWKALYEPFEGLFGVCITAFEPGLQFTRSDWFTTESISTETATKILDLVHAFQFSEEEPAPPISVPGHKAVRKG